MDKHKNIITIACAVIMTTIAVSGILYACGSIAGQVEDNKEGVKQGVSERKEIASDVVELKLSKERQQATAENTLKTLSALHSTMSVMQETQAKQATIQAVNSEKLKTLTKD